MALFYKLIEDNILGLLSSYISLDFWLNFIWYVPHFTWALIPMALIVIFLDAWKQTSKGLFSEQTKREFQDELRREAQEKRRRLGL